MCSLYGQREQMCGDMVTTDFPARVSWSVWELCWPGKATRPRTQDQSSLLPGSVVKHIGWFFFFLLWIWYWSLCLSLLASEEGREGVDTRSYSVLSLVLVFVTLLHNLGDSQVNERCGYDGQSRPLSMHLLWMVVSCQAENWSQQISVVFNVRCYMLRNRSLIADLALFICYY